jgi:hypothetical protein
MEEHHSVSIGTGRANLRIADAWPATRPARRFTRGSTPATVTQHIRLVAHHGFQATPQ